MYAELVINIEAALSGTFHYAVPRDLAPSLRLGQLVEVEFGNRLAQGIVIAFDQEAPVEDVKPIISVIDPEPVVQPYQIQLARRLSSTYITPLNACLRLMLPPGLTRWSDITLAIHPRYIRERWRQERLTEAQEALLTLLEEKGDRRGRQIGRALGKKSNWRNAAAQLERRGLLLRGSVLDPPRVRPKKVRTAALIGSPRQLRRVLSDLGRASKEADLLLHLLDSPDPLLALDGALETTGAGRHHAAQLAAAGLVQISPARRLAVAGPQPAAGDAAAEALLARLPAPADDLPPETLTRMAAAGQVGLVEEPETISLAVARDAALDAAYEKRGATRYRAIVRALADAAQPLPVGALYAATDCNLNHLRRLVKLDVIRLGSEEVWRDPLADRDFVPAEAPRLTGDQARVWGRLKMRLLGVAAEEPERPEKRPVLLHGVTGSGKTEIYMRAIRWALAQEQQALVLVPEIALTPQTVRRFAARFPGRVAILHSRLSDGERYDTWRRARSGQIDILIGPRSALFAPLPNPGVIVLDEEHDPSYKQTPPVPPPYYHTRAAAEMLGEITDATVILGSATPDITTYHRARAGAYLLLSLPRRVMGHRGRIASQAARLQVESRYEPLDEEADEALSIPLPPVQIVDLRQELRAGNRSVFSRALQTAVDETLARGEQAILFLNRRGTSTFVICRDCGHVLRCPRCDTPLTYHRPRLALTCHQCNHREPPHQECPACGSKRIRYFGLGTEELETRVAQRWPAARIVRWDRDTTAGRDSHEALLASFINQEADVLVGTQMIAKGLDLPLVTLVGVISADISLGLPDYRTGERTFQVLAQVAGRAGRGLRGGRVLIQTYKPEHYAIQAAAAHDYVQFYLEEIRFRTRHSYPPFRRLARLLLSDPVNERAEREAKQLAGALRAHAREKALAATEILGPTPPFFSRVDGRYRWQIIVRAPDPVRLLADFPIPARWALDIDPVSTL